MAGRRAALPRACLPESVKIYRQPTGGSVIRYFERPRTVEEALELHHRYGREACWLGGWALADRRGEERRFVCAIALDDIRIDGRGLAGVEVREDTARVGALTSLQDVMDDAALPDALRAAAAFQPSRPLRCMGTVGGDIAARRTDSCLAVPLTALGAVLELAGDASVSVNNYVSVEMRDLILHVRVPLGRRCAVARHTRNARGPVLLTAAVGWDADGGGIAAVVAGPGLPLQRLPAVESLLAEDACGAAVERAVRKAVAPVDDWLGSAAYKAHLAAVAVADCADACREGRVSAC